MKFKVTISLIIINIIMFILTLGGFLFSDLLGNSWEYTLKGHQYYRLLTCMFVHFGLSHIICNTISLVHLGLLIENAYGSKKFFIVYMLSGLGSSFCSAFFNMIFNRSIISAGASGAICGLIGILLADLKGNKKGLLINLLICLIPIFYIGFGVGVDNIAHFSGVFCGFILGRLFRKKDIENDFSNF